MVDLMRSHAQVEERTIFEKITSKWHKIDGKRFFEAPKSSELYLVMFTRFDDSEDMDRKKSFAELSEYLFYLKI